MDSAGCTCGTRKKWLALLRSNAVIMTLFSFKDKCPPKQFYEWAVLQRLKSRCMYIDRCVSVDLFIHNVQYTGEKVTRCSLFDINKDMLVYNTVLATHCKKLHFFRLQHCRVDDSVRRVLSSSQPIEELEINNCRNVDKLIFRGMGCPHLKMLSLENCNCDDDCVAAGMNMSDAVKRLHIGENRALTDAVFRTVARYASLVSLSLCGTMVSDQAMLHISSNCDCLQVVDINECVLLTDATASKCRRLSVLWVNKNRNVTGAALTAIVNARNKLSHTDFSDCPHISTAAVVCQGKKARRELFFRSRGKPQSVCPYHHSAPVCSLGKARVSRNVCVR